MHRLLRRGGGRHKADWFAIAPAVVVPWRNEGDNGECLRYALRSWRANLPHSHVIVAGDPAPRWFDPASDRVTFLELPRQATRFDDSQTSVLTALTRVMGWAYICHDDMFVMQSVDWVGPVIRGGMPHMVSRMARNQYYRRGNAARLWLIDQGIQAPLNYNVHTPFLCHADTYRDIADRAAASGLIAGYRASLYGNLMRLPARKVPDPKITSNGVRPNDRWACWSMSDQVWRQGIAGKLVRQRLMEPAPWELRGAWDVEPRRHNADLPSALLSPL